MEVAICMTVIANIYLSAHALGLMVCFARRLASCTGISIHLGRCLFVRSTRVRGYDFVSPFSGLPHCKPASRSDNHPSYMGHPVPAGGRSKMDWPVRKLFQFKWMGRWSHILYVSHLIWTGWTRYCTILNGPASKLHHPKWTRWGAYCTILIGPAGELIVPSKMNRPKIALYHPKCSGRRSHCPIPNGQAGELIVPS
jgi:hypothetical protein